SPPPLAFASLQPSSNVFERQPGSRVSFRAEFANVEASSLSYRWEINGQAASDARGPGYDLDPPGPGTYVVRLLATAPWGASLANAGRLRVPKPAPAPPPVEALVRPTPEPPMSENLEAEARAWIQSYCNAFQRKDTDSLIALGHISSQAEAVRLRDA